MKQIILILCIKFSYANNFHIRQNCMYVYENNNNNNKQEKTLEKQTKNVYNATKKSAIIIPKRENL